MKNVPVFSIWTRERRVCGPDRQAVVDKVFRGAGSVGSAGYVPQGSLYYNDHVVAYPYDPEKRSPHWRVKTMK